MNVAAQLAPLVLLCSVGLLQAESPSASKNTISLFDGKALDGWRINDKVFFKDHGPVEVKNGVIRLATGDPATGITFTGDVPTMNYEIRLSAMRTEGSDFFCGLTFPVGDSFQTLIIGGWGGGVTGLSTIDGDSAVDNETVGYTEFENNRWYKIRVRVAAGEIKAWIDDENIVDFETTGHRLDIRLEQDTAKPLSICTWKTAAALKEIELERLNVPD